MADLSKVDDTTLIDLLADYTNRYTKLFPQQKEYKECKEALDAIISEINRRRKKDEVNNDQLLSETNTNGI